VLGVRFLHIHSDRVYLQENVNPTPYACLSHCWGTEALLTTTNANRDVHAAQGLPVPSLPRTFQDAIHTCTQLGISYIWIDSLCIVQDNIEDWRMQSAPMADIYEGCFVTIAATHSGDSSGGLFCETSLELRGEAVPGYSDLHIRRLPPSPSYPASDTNSSNAPSHYPSEWPVLTRGWTYQELSLSPRTIHYGSQELFWQCQRTHKRQCSTIPFERISSFALQDLRSTEAAILGQGYIQQEWYNAVQEYSSRQLTFDKDRLPAIAAIAQQIWRLRPNDEYIAGLWKSTLLFDLMWYRSEDSVDQGRCEPEPHIRMPSWSWASIRGAVEWPWFLESEYDPPGRPLDGVAVSNITREYHGSAVSGEIVTASILLRAPLINLKAALTDYVEKCVEGPILIADFPSFTDTEGEWELCLTNWFRDSHHGPIGDRVFGLPLIFCNDGSSEEHGSPSCEQHLLVVADSKDTETYVRLGVAQITLAPPKHFEKWIVQPKSDCESADAAATLLRYLGSLPIQEITLV
jgi:hypothetical protein